MDAKWAEADARNEWQPPRNAGGILGVHFGIALAGGGASAPNAECAAAGPSIDDGAYGSDGPAAQEQSARQRGEVRALGLATLVGNAPFGTALVDEDLRLLGANPALVELAGGSYPALVGRSLRDALPSLAPALEPHLRRVLATGRPLGGVTLGGLAAGRAASGRSWLGAFFFVDFDEGLAGAGAALMEITTLQRSAEAALRARDELLAIVAHDLRTPLSAILAGAQILAAADDERDVSTVAERIARAATRMSGLVHDLVDATGMRAGQLTIDPRPTSAGALLAEAHEVLEPLGRARSVRIVVTPPAPELEVLADLRRVHQVLENLVGNALKFTPAGGEIALSCVADGERARFTVRDTGPGVPTSARAHLFERFWSAGAGAQRGVGVGLGLGLYIARAIVEAHGGKIWCEGGPRDGGRFAFTLPSPRGRYPPKVNASPAESD